MAKLHEVKLHKLRPTQITVGMIEVHDKRAMLEAMKAHEQRDFLEAHPIPAVWGPDDKLYITDHHHLGRAAQDAGLESGFFLVEEDLSKHEPTDFWRAMEAARWAHPIDEHGRRCSCLAIPNHLEALRDDVYRSLAGYVRNAGGYTKTATAFAEFLWADYFRARIPVGPKRADFEAAVAQAMRLAHDPAARGLPGYIVKPES